MAKDKDFIRQTIDMAMIGRKIWVFYCNDIQKTSRDEFKQTDDFSTYDGLTLGLVPGNSAILFGKKVMMSTITHEIYHAVVDVTVPLGIEPSSNTEEVYAYSIGYVTEQILKFIKKHPEITLVLE